MDLDKDLLTCPLNLVKCEHCKLDVVSAQMTRHHLLMCLKFPLNCPVCGQREIYRENIHNHLSPINGTCQMITVPCSFRHLGCLFQDKRCKMVEHYKNFNTQHLMMLTTRLIEMETKHRLELQDCKNRFENVITGLIERVESVEKKNSQLEILLTN